MQKADGIIIGVFFVFFTSFVFFHSGDSVDRYVAVEKNGSQIEMIRISNDTCLVKKYGNNVVEIRNGKVRMIHSDCPDQDCVKAGAISKNGQILVCLPERFVVKIVSADGEIDAIAK